jgi:phospholipid/cholesterol/gamma-HCH transport system substrate-binding protein
MRTIERILTRLRIDPRAALGLLLLVGGTLIWLLILSNVIPSLFRGGGVTVRAVFASTEGIVSNDPVRIGGVDVGHVSSVVPDTHGRSATIIATLDGSAPAIHRDASASIRWRTLLGGSYEVSLDPGSPTAPTLGSRAIPETRTSYQVELDEITRVMSRGARQGVRTMLGQLGPAFADHRAPAQTFSTLARVAPSIASGVGALRGIYQDADLRQLVRQTAQAADALDAPAEGTQRFVRSAATTFEATASSDASIRSTIAKAATVLPRMRTTLAGLDHTFGLANPLIRTLTAAAPAVAPTLTALHPTITDANTLLEDATPLLHPLRRAVSSLAAAAQTGVPVIEALEPSLQRLDTQILPNLDRVSPESKHPIYQMIGPTLQAMGQATSGFDQNGFYVRLTGNSGSHALNTLPCTTTFSDPTADTLLTCETVLGAIQQIFTPQANIFGELVSRLDRTSPRLAKALLQTRLPGGTR